MSDIKIEKGVPVPAHKVGKPLKFPFDKMEVGDSFLGDIVARSSAASYGRRHGMKFASRKEGKKIRIWRVE